MTQKNTPSEKYSGEKAKVLSTRMKWVKWLFYGTAVGNFFMVIGSGLLFGLDFSRYDAEFDVSHADWVLIFGGLIYTVAFIGSIIAFLMLSFRAMKNLHIWGSRSAEMAPGWTVGWYFIPFANLWKPYQAMSQIWDGTVEVARSATAKYPSIGGWWLFWVVTNISANISFRIALNGGYSETAIKSGAAADIVSGISGIIAVIIIVPILVKITEMQDSKIKGEVFV